jgi:hypothetical protein
LDKAKRATKGVIAMVPLGEGKRTPEDADKMDVEAKDPLVVEAEVVQEETEAKETEAPV